MALIYLQDWSIECFFFFIFSKIMIYYSNVSGFKILHPKSQKENLDKAAFLYINRFRLMLSEIISLIRFQCSFYFVFEIIKAHYNAQYVLD